MDRLIRLEPSSVVAIRVEPGQKCRGELTLRNVMHTMPVAFRLLPVNRARFSVRPQTGIIPPLATLNLELVYILPPGSPLPESYPGSADSFLLHSVVAPGASVKDAPSSLDSVPLDWFTAKKKQVFTDSGVRVVFVGSVVLAALVSEGDPPLEAVREVLERSDPAWRAADSVDPATGESLLHLAVARGRPDLVQLLLEFEPDLESTGRPGRTPLEAAAAAGEALIAELLLSRRASTSRTPASEMGPLHLAASAGHAEVVQLLLSNGADPDEPTADGRSPLHVAVEGRRRDIAKLLADAGCRVDARGGPDGDTPLHAAAEAGDEALARLLLRRGGLACKLVRNARGMTACELAAEQGHGGRLLDALGRGDQLHGAARRGDVTSVRRLVGSGAAADGRDQHGWTALMRAAFKGKVEVMRALLEAGAAVDARDEEGYTALHCAAEGGQAEAVELLVKRGADLEARTAKGATAMQVAELLGYVGIVRALTQGGAAAAPPAKGGKLGRVAVALREKRSGRVDEKKGVAERTAAVSRRRRGGGRMAERAGWPAVAYSR